MRVTFAIVALGCLIGGEALALSDEEISTFGGCYFAPMTSVSLWRMRDQDGAIREFEPTGKSKVWSSVDGWTAAIGKGVATVRAPAREQYPALQYNFKNGRLESLDVEGRHCRFNYPDPLVYEDEEICPLWPDVGKITREQFAAETTMWKNDGRLRMGFASPNQAGTFITFVALILLGLATSGRIRSRPVRVTLLSLAVVSLVLLAMTGSRSSILALAAGLLPLLLCRASVRGRMTVRRVVTGAAVGLIAAAVVLSAAYIKGRSRAGDKKSDAQRVELIKAVPAMLHDAPGGWRSFGEVGRAYSDWYQPASDLRVRFNLVSDQLTQLVRYGWVKSAVYVFLWMTGLGILLMFAIRGGSPIPVALGLALSVASTFNVVMFSPYMLWLPIGSLALFLFDGRWRKRDFWPKPLISSAVVAAAVMIVGVIVCKSVPREFRLMHHADGRSVINGEQADIWVVDDGEVLGVVTTSRDIRGFYDRFPMAPAIGYVKGLSDIPARGVRRLVLSGETGESFLFTFKMKCLPIALPPEIVFLAPSFPPSEIPLELRAQAKVSYVIGEFAARYHPDLANPPKWCTLVPGAEVYIPGWMRFCLN